MNHKKRIKKEHTSLSLRSDLLAEVRQEAIEAKETLTAYIENILSRRGDLRSLGILAEKIDKLSEGGTWPVVKQKTWR